MSNAKRTDWFDGDVTPVRKGIYERRQSPNQALFWLWNGDFWEAGGWPTPNSVIEGRSASISQKYPWRGLARRPR